MAVTAETSGSHRRRRQLVGKTSPSITAIIDNVMSEHNSMFSKTKRSEGKDGVEKSRGWQREEFTTFELMVIFMGR
jgi:hypothetical protein